MAVICYDKDGNVLKNFTQWDTGQTIAISGVDVSSAPEVHYGVQNKTMAYKVSSTIENGMVKANVPNQVLREHGLLTVWLHYNDGQGSQRTETSIGIYVLPKQKPADYEYDDDTGADGTIGNLDDLLTEDKDTLVGAINEIFGITEQLGSEMENIVGKFVIFRGNLPQTANSTITVQTADLIPEESVSIGTTVLGNNGYFGTVTSLIGVNDEAVVTATGGKWSEIGYTDLGALPSGTTNAQFIAVVRPDGKYHFSYGDYHCYFISRDVYDHAYNRCSYRLVWDIGDDAISDLRLMIDGNWVLWSESGRNGTVIEAISNSSLPTGLVNKGYVDGRFDTANRPQLRIAAVAFPQHEGTSLTMELADVMPSDKLAVGDVLVGTNGITATVTGINDDMVYTESRGQKYNLQAGSVFYAGVKDAAWDAQTGAMTGGRLLTSFPALRTAYERGYLIQLDIITGNEDQYHDTAPMTYMGPGKVCFDKTYADPNGSGSSFFLLHLEINQSSVLSGYKREVSVLDEESF